MVLAYSTLRKPVNSQVVDPSTGVMREEWALYFQDLTTRLNGAVDALSADPAPADAEYITNAANATLTAERALANSASIVKNVATPGAISLERAALTGDVTASANSNATTIANDAVTYAKLQNVSATSRIIGRKTSGAGDAEEITLSEVLDFIGSAAQGDILYRGSSAWARLAAGTAGQILTTGGAAANPAWGNGGAVLLTSGTISSAATLDIVLTSYTSYKTLTLVLQSVVPATDDVELWTRFSTNGSSYDASASNYAHSLCGAKTGSFIGQGSTGDTKIIVAGGASGSDAISNTAAESGVSAILTLFSRTSASLWTGIHGTVAWYTAFGEAAVGTVHGLRKTGQDTDAIRILFESGNIASGSYALYGVT